MGCFGYICPICRKSIRNGERCILIHKRNGVEIGRTEGHYDSYGGVEEDSIFRGESGPNSHEEICKSEFQMDSSFRFGRMRMLPDGRLLDSDVISSFVKEYVRFHGLETISTEMKIQNAKDLENKSFFEAKMYFGTSRKVVSNEAVATLAAYRLQEHLCLEIEKDGKRVETAHDWALSLPK